MSSKAKIHKISVRPVLTYAIEIRPDTSRTKQLLQTTKMSALRMMLGNIKRDRIRNDIIRNRVWNSKYHKIRKENKEQEKELKKNS